MTSRLPSLDPASTTTCSTPSQSWASTERMHSSMYGPLLYEMVTIDRRGVVDVMVPLRSAHRLEVEADRVTLAPVGYPARGPVFEVVMIAGAGIPRPYFCKACLQEQRGQVRLVEYRMMHVVPVYVAAQQWIRYGPDTVASPLIDRDNAIEVRNGEA